MVPVCQGDKISSLLKTKKIISTVSQTKYETNVCERRRNTQSLWTTRSVSPLSFPPYPLSCTSDEILPNSVLGIRVSRGSRNGTRRVWKSH